MHLHNRKPFNRLISLGLILLAIANISKWLLERHTSMPEGPRDGFSGLLFGMAIGCTLLGIWRMRRSGPGRESSC